MFHEFLIEAKMIPEVKTAPERKFINTFSKLVGVELPLSIIGVLWFKFALERRSQSSVFSSSLNY